MVEGRPPFDWLKIIERLDARIDVKIDFLVFGGLRSDILNRFMYKSVIFLSVIIFAVSCSSEQDEERLIDVTDAFLSEFKLMQGDKNAFTPDRYFSPGGLIGVVKKGELVYCRLLRFRVGPTGEARFVISIGINE